jgi:hypothetical protein
MDYRQKYYTTIDRLSSPNKLPPGSPDFRKLFEQSYNRIVKKGVTQLKRYLVANTRKVLSGRSPSSPFSPPGRKTGRLVRSIYSEVRKVPTLESGGLLVLGTRKYGWYGPLLDWGTGLYGSFGSRIVPKRAKFLRFQIGGKVIFTRSVRGAKPRPWIHEIEKIFSRFHFKDE